MPNNDIEAIKIEKKWKNLKSMPKKYQAKLYKGMEEIEIIDAKKIKII